MQIALLTADSPCDTSTSRQKHPPLLAGQTILQHQLELVIAVGCESVVCLVERPPLELEAMRQTCARAGIPLRLLHRPQELSALVTATDRLLVIGANTLMDIEQVPHHQDETQSILSVPAEQAIPLGFERIDVNRAWAGVMQLPGSLVEALHQLPGDVDPASALLRIALMSGVPIKELTTRVLAEGRLIRPRSAVELQAIEADRISRSARPIAFAAPARAVIERLSIRVAHRVLESRRSISGISVLIAAILLSVVLAGHAGLIALALALTAPAYAALAGLRIIRRVARRGKYHSQSTRLEPVMDAASDAVLVFALASANPAGVTVGASWFIPAVLLGLLRLAQSRSPAPVSLMASDRVLLAGVLLLAHIAGFLSAAVMLLAAATLAALFAYDTGPRDITTT